MKNKLVLFFFAFFTILPIKALALSYLPEKPYPGAPLLLELPKKVKKVEFLGKNYRPFAYRQRFYALLAVPLNTKPGSYPLKIYAEKIYSYQVKIYPKKYPEEHLEVPPKMIHYPPEVIDRIKREVKAIKQALRGFTPEPLLEGPFVWPVAGRLSSPFGFRRVYNGVPRSHHSGIDIAVPKGTPVKAANSGRVVLTGDFYLPGKIVIIDHGLGIYTVYCHLDKILVKTGQAVDKGEKIALSGASGRVTGPHLHFGCYIEGVKVDPKMLLEVF
ncbi:Peptidase M23 [Thermodesulfatator indicus DSM 15286]|uniref:Peptidase M23 n=1 Tax=Thermodesulfatator indicus (strain DSM 15286 / JCM 11887 / CIR29812) TaxID=667014 RepID=F8AAH8_THEID|nr:Peptidase M23 [Thermodesulfatator indicus DSM 15286]